VAAVAHREGLELNGSAGPARQIPPMAFSISYLDPLQTVLVTAYGSGDAQEGRRVVTELAANPHLTTRGRVLIDLRQLTYIPSPAEARMFGNLFASNLPGHRIALVAPEGVAFGMARIVEQLSELHGGGALATFTDVDEAVVWLQQKAERDGAA
jgi:hypothetical protein